MRKYIWGLVLFVIFISFLNINVTTRKGINYKLSTVRLPLYLKLLDFFDRHYNYVQLTKEIIKGAKTDEECVMKIFKWTNANIRKVPEGLPIIDDHVWYTIIRGYGMDDQFSDIFTTLCNYSGRKAFYLLLDSKDTAQRIPISFVKIKDRLCIFDPYRGVYFEDGNNNFIGIKAIQSGQAWVIRDLGVKPEIDYSSLFSNLPEIKLDELRRANIQSPLRRLLFQLSKFKLRFG